MKIGRNLALEAEMRDLQRNTAEGHKMASQLQKTLEEKLQQQQDALWVKFSFFFLFQMRAICFFLGPPVCNSFSCAIFVGCLYCLFFKS